LKITTKRLLGLSSVTENQRRSKSMKKHFQINDEVFRCEPQARHRLMELKLSTKDAVLELWEISQQEDIFGKIRQVKQLVTRYTPNLPNNGIFRIHDTFDVRRAKKLYSLQKYDSDNHCWNNFKMGNSVPELLEFMNSYVEVK
jgi:hypothetical protein